MTGQATISAEADEELAHLYRLMYRDLRICGCGEPGQAYDLVRDLLELAPFYDNPDAVRARAGATPGNSGAYWLILYLLDDAGLIRHSSMISGSWLTPKGEHYLALMRKHAWGAVDESGYPHEGVECLRECPHWQPEAD